MELTEKRFNISDQSVFLAWKGAPINTYYYDIYSSPRPAPAAIETCDFSDFSFLGRSDNSFFSDLRFYKQDITKRDSIYVVCAKDQNNAILDVLTINTAVEDSELVAKMINVGNYQAHLLFRNPIWSDVYYILRKRTSGVKCSCYLPDFKASSDPTCKKCYGTGFVGGFYTPIPTKCISLDYIQKDPDVMEALPTGSGQRTMVVPRYPAIYKDDYLLSDTQGSFVVMNVSKNTVKNQVTPTILVTLNELDNKNAVANFNFTAVIPHIAKIMLLDQKVVIQGSNLIPAIGGVSCALIGGLGEEDCIELSTNDLLKVSESELVFYAKAVERKKIHTPISYMFFLNNLLYKGIAE